VKDGLRSGTRSYFWALLLDRQTSSMCTFHGGVAFYRKSAFVLVSRLLGVRRLILHCHGGRFPGFYQSRSRLGRWWIRTTLGAADRLLVVSNELREFFEQLSLKAHVQVLANPVFLPPETTARSTERQSSSVSASCARGKARMTFWRPCRRSCGSCPSVEVHFAGTGDTGQIQGPACARALGRSGEAARVGRGARETGAVREGESLCSALSRRRPFRSPSSRRWPTGSRSSARAWVESLDVVVEGETGFLVEPGDAAAIACRVIRL